MRAIIVDDDPLMLRKFEKASEGITGLHLNGQFQTAQEALEYALNNPVEVAFLDIVMPKMSGIELAKRLREIREDMLIVFVSGDDSYLHDSNVLGGDYYLVKPYDRETLEIMMEKLFLLSQRQRKRIYVQTFGTFSIFKDGKPLSLTGKAKEILAFLVAARGNEMSNRMIYTTLWEGRPYSNREMQTYYNALRRLKQTLEDEDIGNLLISTTRGHMINTELIDCDYYSWMDMNPGRGESFEGEFLTDYSWSEDKVGGLMKGYLDK